MSEPCPVCKTISEIQGTSINGRISFRITCPRCGRYQIDDIAKAYLNIQLKKLTQVAVLSHAIRKMQRNTEIPSLDQRIVGLILQNHLPKPAEQMNNFVLWLGDNAPNLGEEICLDMLRIQADIGVTTQEGVQSIIKHLIEKKIVSGKFFGVQSTWELTLTIDGWECYEGLKRGRISSRRAFMAMQYREKELDGIVAKYFRPAVKAAGFELYRLDDAPRAGLIDDHLKVEIRTSRFLIADLTHENRGAYWEAGFAQGLGKPVIYTCEKSKFEQQKTHFDTNHHTTVVWDRDNLEKAAIDLKNTIRETLPEEAKLTDDE